MQHSEYIKELLSKLTLDEKIGMVHGNGFFETKGVNRLGIPPLKMSDGPMGVRQEFPNNSWSPRGLSDDYVTYFPSNMALAATWNPDLAYDFGQALGAETRGRGKDVILAPGINIVRSPLCGRNFEYMSEDPYLISQMAPPIIQGIQTNDVASCVKHFALNNQETRRLEVDVMADERSLEEIYLPGFKACLTGSDTKAKTVMASYNKFRGDYACESHYLLRDILRSRWAYDGVIISDWGACHSTHKAAMAGLDIEMSVTDDFEDYYFAEPLMNAIIKNQIDMELIDEKVLNILHLMEQLGMLGNTRQKGALNCHKHQLGTLETARESIVLLGNDDAFLPMDASKIKSILVVGDNANRRQSQGGGSAEIKALYEHTPLSGITMALGGNARITFTQGYEPDVNAPSYVQFNHREKAVRLAGNHDVVLFVGGLNHDFDTEGRDMTDIILPYEQDLTIMALANANPNLVVVNLSGTAVDLSVANEYSKALLQTWYNGMEGGRALAEILFGHINPSGRLPITFAKNLDDYPSHSIGEFPGSDQVHYEESIFVGYRHFDTHGIEPLFPFGYGLSYTKFSYNTMKLSCDHKHCMVEIQLQNRGKMTGSEIIQVYVEDLESSEPRPVKELKAFKKVTLKPGQTHIVTFELSHEAFSFYSQKQKKWVFESGSFTIYAGSSSVHLPLSGDIAL